MRAVLRIAIYVAAFAVGSALASLMVLMIFDPAVVTRAAEAIKDPSTMTLLWILATVLVLCPIWLVVRWSIARRRVREISYVTETGKVSVSLVAIEEALTRAVENENCIKKATVRLYEDRLKRQVIIEAVVTLWETPNITERTRACQQLLRRRFAELMPEQSAVQVYFTVARVQQARKDERKAEPVALTEPVQPAPEPAPDSGERQATDSIDATLRTDTVSSDSRYGTDADTFDPYRTPGGEDDLYVGPSYPVESDDEDSGSQASVGKDAGKLKKS